MQHDMTTSNNHVPQKAK